MARPQRTPHTLHVTTERLDVATSWLRENGQRVAQIGRSALIMATVGLLICDDTGTFTEAELMSAMADPDAISAAELLANAVVS